MRWIRLTARIWTVLLASCLALLLGALLVRAVAPRFGAPETLAVALEPTAGSDEIAPDSRLILTFSRPMNRLATLKALQLTPAADGTWQWSDDARQLTFTPAVPFASATSYAVTLAADAQMRWWQPIGRDRQFVVTTATRPTVRAVLPPQHSADGSGPLALTFDQPMVDAGLVGSAADLSALRLLPPTALSGRWLDRSTLLVTPQRPLTPAAVYQLEVSTALRDARGIALAAPFSATFTTAWPTALGASTATQLTSDGVLTVTLAANLDPATVRRALRSTPESDLLVSSTPLEAGRLYTITARDGWRPATRYRIDWLPPAVAVVPLPIWQFETTGNPGLIAAFPGSDQPLQPGEELRLTFATPMEGSALQAGLSIDPPAPLELTVIGTGVRLRPTLAAATTYTLTIAAGTRDRNGVPLAEPIVLNVRAGSSLPSAEWLGGATLTFATAQTATVTLRTVNVDSVSLALFRLDDAGLIRAVEAIADGSTFDPQRIGLALLADRTAQINSERDRVVLTTLPLTIDAAGTALPPGAYWLAGRSAAGSTLQRLVLVSDLQLHAAAGPANVVVLAQDRSGAPRAGVPVRVYENRSLVISGMTDDRGVLNVELPRPSAAPLLVISGDGQPAALQISAGATAELQLLTVPERLTIGTDEPLRLDGLVLQGSPDGSRAAAAQACRLSLIDDSAGLLREQRCAIDDDGRLSAELHFNRFAPAGKYRVRLTVGSAQQDLTVRRAASGDLLAVGREVGSDTLSVSLIRRDRPAAGEQLDYTLTLTPTAVFSGELRFGNDGSSFERSGSQRSDAFGRLTLPLELPEHFGRFEYRLTIRAAGPAGRDAVTLIGSLAAANDRIGLTAPRVTAGSEPFNAAILATAADGTPRSVSLSLDIRRTDGTLIISRLVTTADDGTAAVRIPGLAAGNYRVTARRAGAAVTQELTVVTASGDADESFRLQADRPAYRVGESVRLAVTAPRSPAELLLIFSRGAVRETHRLTVVNGSLIELPLGPALAPGVRVDALLSNGTERWSYGFDLPVSADAAPLTLSADAVDGLPGRDVALTLTTPPGTLLTLLVPADGRLPDPAQLTVHPAELRSTPGAVAQAVMAGVVRDAQLIAVERLTDASTVLQRVTLPATGGNYTVAAYLFSDDGRTQLARQPLRSRLPLELVFLAPRELRAGDETDIRALARSPSPGVAPAVVDLQVRGADLLSPPRVSAVPTADGLIELRWRIRARPLLQPISLEARLADGGPLIGQLLLTSVNDEDARLGATQLISGSAVLTLTAATDVLIAPTPATLLNHWHQRLSAAATARTDQLALQLLLSRQAPVGSSGRTPDLQQLQADLLAELIARQQREGGWSALPGGPADPLSTLIALDVLLELDDTSLAPPRAFRYLAAVEASLPADLAAYTAALRARNGAPFTLPATEQLSDTGLAFALQAGGTDVERLAALAERRYRAWLNGGRLSSSLTDDGRDAAALLAQQLHRRRIMLIDGTALAALLADAGPQGLRDPFSTLQLARSLRLITEWPAGSYQPALNGRPLSVPDSAAAQRARFAAGTLVITATRPIIVSRTDHAGISDGVDLPAWQLTDRNGTAQPLDALSAGEYYLLEQLLLLEEPAARIELRIPLPAGLTVSAGRDNGPFQITVHDSSLVITGAELAAGVYRLPFTVQATYPGRYHIEGASALPEPGPVLNGPPPPIVIVRSR